ncbi:MAG: hypothetical protein KJ000_18440 [Pirellulaceae bacterium]|nr:hypothetical protein [Pirellulaceae bacterium]
MIRGWIAVALLAASWLFGLGYFAPARPIVWWCAVASAVVLLAGTRLRTPSWFVVVVCSVLLLPPVLLMPWPSAAIPALLAAGLWLQRSPTPSRWPRQLGGGAVIASAILLFQAAALQVYEALTARAHELPWPLTAVVGGIAGLLGMDAAVDGAALTIRDSVAPQRIAATWELLFDPASVLFLVGGLVWLACFGWIVGRPNSRRASMNRGQSRPLHRVSVARRLSLSYSSLLVRWGWYLRPATQLVLVWLLWLPLRTGLLIALLVHRTLRADPYTMPNVGDLFVNSWLHAGLLAGLVALAARWVVLPLRAERAGRVRLQRSVRPKPSRRAVAAPAACVAVGTALLIMACYWVPVGRPQAGRVMVIERHSTWEPTTEPYGTKIYGEAGSYNYAAIYEYCGQFFEMSRLLEQEAIDDRRLADCDVLIVKTPTSRYMPGEVDAIERFVRGGGALLLIGDHTNVFNMNTYLNDISRRFGFTFRNDLLFAVSTPYEQRYRSPPLKHPALRHLPPLNFAVSCSIDPGRSPGRMVIRSTGLWSLPPAYQEINYHPQAEYRSDMQYGAWCQAWSTHAGAGRVIGFGDSTLFSNFCTFQPGKAELFLGMVQWLNCRSWLDHAWLGWLVWVPSVVIGSFLVGWGVWFGRRQIAGGRLIAAAAMAGWAVAALLLGTARDAAMPWPQAVRPLSHVVIDREISEVPLFTGAFADSKDGRGYGMFEQWIPRTGCYLSRRSGRDVFDGDALVIISPTRSVSDDYLDGLERFVAAGGHLLVVDSPDVEGSTAFGLLEAFGLSSIPVPSPPDALPLQVADCDVQPPMLASRAIAGGEPIAWWNQQVVAARKRHGAGMVTAIGFGSLFNDAAMGFHWLPAPDDATLERYDAMYALLRLSLPVSAGQSERFHPSSAARVGPSDDPNPPSAGSPSDP